MKPLQCGVCNEPMVDPCTAMCGCTFCHRHAHSTFKSSLSEETNQDVESGVIKEGSVVILPHGNAAVVVKREGEILVVSSPQGRTRVLMRDVEWSEWLSHLKPGDLVTLPTRMGHATAGAVIPCHNDGMLAVEAQPEGYVWEGPLGSISPFKQLALDPFTFPMHVPNGQHKDAYEGMENYDHAKVSTPPAPTPMPICQHGWIASSASNDLDLRPHVVGADFDPMTEERTLDEYIVSRLNAMSQEETRGGMSGGFQALNFLRIGEQALRRGEQALREVDPARERRRGRRYDGSTHLPCAMPPHTVSMEGISMEEEEETDELERGAAVRLVFSRALRGMTYGIGRVLVKRDHIGIVGGRRSDGSYTVHFCSARNTHFRRCELQRVSIPKIGNLVRVAPHFSGHCAGKLTAHAVGKLVSMTFDGFCRVDFGDFYRNINRTIGDCTKSLWSCHITDIVKDERSEHDPVFPLPHCPLCDGAMGEVIRSDKAIATMDFTCGICGDILADPVTLGCGHSFCHQELQLWFRSNDTCPICRERFPSLGATVREKVILRRFMTLPSGENGRQNGAVLERKERVVLHAVHKMKRNRIIQDMLEEEYGAHVVYERQLSVHADSVVTILKTQDEPESIADRYPVSERILQYLNAWDGESIRGLMQTGLFDTMNVSDPLTKDHTLLMYAVQTSLCTVEILLGMGADVNYAISTEGNHKNFSALSCAAASGQSDIVDRLALLSPKSHFPVAIREAMKAGYGQLGLDLRERLSTEDDEQRQCRTSCLVLACRLGDVDLLSRFVEDYNDPLWERADDVEPDVASIDTIMTELDSEYRGREQSVPDFISRPTPLEACTSKKCIKYLLDRRLNSRIENPSYPVHAACANAPYRCFTEVLDAFIEAGYDINEQDIDGRTPLFYIWRSGTDDARARLEVLLERGAKCNIVDRQGRHILHLAAAKGDIGVFEAVIGHSSWAIDYNGQSPLHVSCKFGRRSFLDHILRCKSPSWNLREEGRRKDINLKTPYMLLSNDIRNTDVGEALLRESLPVKRERDEDAIQSSRRFSSLRRRHGDTNNVQDSGIARVDCLMQ